MISYYLVGYGRMFVRVDVIVFVPLSWIEWVVYLEIRSGGC
jgi:hypothetical protein